MSAEALDRIIKEVEALTPEERRELLDRLVDEEHSQGHQMRSESFKETVKDMTSDFEKSAFSQINTHNQQSPGESATLREWLNETRKIRTTLPLTSDSVNILRELREARSKQ